MRVSRQRQTGRFAVTAVTLASDYERTFYNFNLLFKLVCPLRVVGGIIKETNE